MEGLYFLMTNPVFSDGSDEDTIRRWTQEARALSGVKAPDALVCALAPILSSSSHLSQLASRYHEDIIRLWQGEAEAILSEAEEQFIQNITAAKDDEEVKTVLRQFRNRSHFAIALAEKPRMARISALAASPSPTLTRPNSTRPRAQPPPPLLVPRAGGRGACR